MTRERPFILDLTASAGAAMATLSPEEDRYTLHEWSSWLRIRSDVSGFVAPTINPDDDELTGFVPPVFEEDGLALLAVARNMEDLPGEAVGLYHARIEPAELEALQAAVESTPWLDLPRPAGGDYGSPTLTIAYQCGSKRITRSFNARSSNFIEAIAPLWRLLDQAMVRAGKSAASTAWLELEAGVDAAAADPLALSLDLRLRARGVGHLVLADPRLPVAADQGPRLTLRAGRLYPECPEASPDDYIELPIPALGPEDPATVLLRPNGRLTLPLRWRAPAPGLYQIEARWQDYRGPVEAVRGQTSVMPLPRTGPSRLGSGPYPIRGTLFATTVVDLRPPA